MPQARVLQTPKIIQIIGSTIRIQHPDISRNLRTFLSTPVAAAGTALTLRDNQGIANADILLIGEVGDKQTEASDVTTANSGTTSYIARGTAAAVTALVFSHEVDAPVTILNERAIRIYGTNSTVAAGELITSVNAIVTPIADAVSIQWSRSYTEYTLISTDTTYTSYFVYFTDGTTNSSASDLVVAAGHGAAAVEAFIQQALDLTDTRLDNKITREMCVRWADNCQDAISQFVYQDSLTGQFVKKDWSWEIIENTTSLTIVQNDNDYALSGLTVALKYPDSVRGIIGVRIGDKEPMEQIDIREMDEELADKPRTATTVVTVVGDTTLNVASTVEFSDSGSFWLNGRQITYTDTGATTFTGIPATGTGSINAVFAVGSICWQDITPGEPKKYSVFDNVIIFNRPPDEDFVGFAVKIRYYGALTRLTEASDTTIVPFTNVFQYFIGSKIEMRKGNYDKAEALMAMFEKKVLANAVADRPLTADQQVYYEFVST